MQESQSVTSEKSCTLFPKHALVPVSIISLDYLDYSFELHQSIDDIRTEWDQYTLPETFSQSDYLKCIELDSPPELKNLYILIRSSDRKIVGTMLLQSLVLKLGDSFQYENYTTNRSYFSHQYQRFRQMMVSKFRFRMLTVGNLYLTGQYGFNFIEPNLNHASQIEIVNRIVKSLKKILRCTEYRFNGVLFKDYFKEQYIESPREFGLLPFQVDPNMIMSIDKSWKSFEDYLLDMRSKYRIRLKNALNKFKGVERKSMQLGDIKKYQVQMYDLYNKILLGSGFVLAKGEENYFVHLKEKLGQRFHVIGYFIGEEMVGFYTWVLDDRKMDSHFIGVNPKLNLRHQIYLNILLDLVKDAISIGADKLYYYRTALEIKSSVGAEPYDMMCYFRHNNWLLNRLFVPTAFKYFVPHQTWVQRHPFRSQIKTG